MVDVFSKKKRSEIMARVKSKNTKFETDFLKLLSAKIYPLGLRYRKHHQKTPGKPDIVFVKQKVAVFLDSDFWHGYNFSVLKPRLKKDYWIAKIRRNIKRDKQVNRILRQAGWTVIRITETSLKKSPNLAVKRILNGLTSTFLK